MAIAYTWGINGLTADASGSVVKVRWKKTGTDENGFSGGFNMEDTLALGEPDSDSYIPFSSLSEADVINWVQSIVVGLYEQDVNLQIQRQIQKKVDEAGVSEVPMPWEPVPEMPAE